MLLSVITFIAIIITITTLFQSITEKKLLKLLHHFGWVFQNVTSPNLSIECDIVDSTPM